MNILKYFWNAYSVWIAEREIYKQYMRQEYILNLAQNTHTDLLK